MAVELPPCPASLRTIQHHLKAASEHDERDPIVSYWCRLCALQTALKIDKKSDEAKVLLMSLMDWLESTKKRMHDNESITNEVAAQAYIENYALKLFCWADSQDRAGVFNKKVVKAFYTAGVLMDVLTVFGELTDEIAAHCKYAKWKAAYINNCLKNGEMPVPGPMKSEESNDSTTSASTEGPSSNSNFNVTPQPGIGFQFEPSGGATLPDPPQTLNFGNNSPVQHPSTMPTMPIPTSGNQDFPSYSNYNVTPTPVTPNPEKTNDPLCNPGLIAKVTGIKLEPEQITKAQKFCKWAISALNYDDVPEAVTNIEKALKLLQTGEES